MHDPIFFGRLNFSPTVVPELSSNSNPKTNPCFERTQFFVTVCHTASHGHAVADHLGRGRDPRRDEKRRRRHRQEQGKRRLLAVRLCFHYKVFHLLTD